MTDTTQIPSASLPTADLVGGTVGDYFSLMKPRVMSLVILTALVGILAAPGHIHPVLGAIALLAIAVGAGASGALNMWYDADIDARMARTAARPIPRGRISAEEAFAFGTVMSVFAVLTLGLLVNYAAGAFLAFTILFYVVVYTMWLKRRTPQNIVIGGAAGAFPPMVGWAAVTGSVSIESLLLFLIIFVWTPPHFWALALYRMRDYDRVGVPMMPNVAGPASTKKQILLYSLALAPLGIAPYFVGLGGLAYLATSTVCGGIFVWYAWQLFQIAGDDRESDAAARRLFGFSILYLFALFLVLLAEHTVRIVTGG